MKKVNLFDKKIIDIFQKKLALVATIITIVLLAVDSNSINRGCTAVALLVFLVFLYFYIWHKANVLSSVTLNIEGSDVIVKVGDIFQQEGFKAIAFNEYFDTQVDEKIIVSRSLNGVFINKLDDSEKQELDDAIQSFNFDDIDRAGIDDSRKSGKKEKFRLGTTVIYQDYLLTAFSKFNEHNQAVLTMPEYLEFLINFWDRLNRVYAQQSVSVPIFGSGITRFKENRNISDEELLKIMLWTFRISEMRFKYPAKLSVIIHKEKMNLINLFDIQTEINHL